MLYTWRRFLRCQAGDVAVEYNVIAAGIAVVALVAMLGAANVVVDVVFRNVAIGFGQGAYEATYVMSSNTSETSSTNTGASAGGASSTDGEAPAGGGTSPSGSTATGGPTCRLPTGGC